MENETSHAVVGDSVAAALEEGRGPRKRRFGWRKKPKAGLQPLTHCENCGEELRGRYCSKCGQAAVNYHRSFRHVVIDVLDSFLNWDSKFIQSIGLLLWKPGWLTNQFLEGKRVRFVHPLRLYLLVSIVFFLCARLIPVSDTHTIKREDMTPEQRALFDTKMAALKEKQKKKHSIFSFSTDEKKTDQPPSMTMPPPSTTATATPSEQASPAESEKEAADTDVEAAINERVDKTVQEKTKSRHLQFGSDKHRAKTPFEQWLEQRVKDQIGEDGAKAKLFMETVRSNLSTMMLCCIPLFAFILKILYLRQKRFYIEHLVYALNIHAFFYLAAILVVLISIGLHRVMPGAPQVLLTLLLSFLVFAQIFISIRRVYRQGWFTSLFKFAFGGFIYLFVIVFGVAATAFVTLALPS
jgi:ribosomal protein L32